MSAGILSTSMSPFSAADTTARRTGDSIRSLDTVRIDGAADLADDADKQEQLMQVSKEFAAVLYDMVFKGMMSGDKEGLPGFGGKGEDMFRDLQTHEFSRCIASSGGDRSLGGIIYQSISGGTGAAVRMQARAAYAASQRGIEP